MLKINAIFAATVLAVATACGGARQETASPAATIKTYVEASRKSDAAAVKQLMSKGTLKMFDEAARAQNVSVDEQLRPMMQAAAKTERVETRGEKIEGDTATLEIKNEQTGTWDTLPLVREDGAWKIAVDKYREKLMKDAGATEDDLPPPPVPANKK